MKNSHIKNRPSTGCRCAAFFLVLVILYCGCAKRETLTLRFVDEDGKPVADVQVGIAWEAPVLKSNQKGICTLDFLKTKSTHIGIWHPDYVYLRCGFGAFGIEPIPKELTVHLERSREGGGIIVDEQGMPIKGVSVHLFYTKDKPDLQKPYPEQLYRMPTYQEPTTDDEGRWTVTWIPTKNFYPLTLSVSVPGYAPQRVDFEQEDESFQALLDKSHQMVLSPGLKLTGKLIAEDGANLERTVVKVGGPFRSIHTPGIVVSETGDFLLNDLVAGTYTIQVIPENHAPLVLSTTLAADSPPVEIPLKHGKPIRFRVTDPEGKPIPGVEMRCFFCHDLESSFFSDLRHVIKATDSEGRTVWNNALDVPCEYVFYHNDYLFVAVPDLIPRDEEYPITMCRKMTVRGTVVDAETKQAVPRFWAAIVGWDESQRDEEHAGWWLPVGVVFPFVEGDISYTIKPMRFAERCRVEITAHGYEPAVSEEFSLKDGDQQFDFELKKVPKTKP
ncbi:MAG: hypothetical protein FWE67_00575 [Planctomycetaceae bacterium]|nr:hypothetical protein [Planctomycetaceae bacterium]